jgi:hypothetical protein
VLGGCEIAPAAAILYTDWESHLVEECCSGERMRADLLLTHKLTTSVGWKTWGALHESIEKEDLRIDEASLKTHPSSTKRGSR